ncbi:MAG: N-6 DNA methylase [Syntrophobacteraceae bacterium]
MEYCAKPLKQVLLKIPTKRAGNRPKRGEMEAEKKKLSGAYYTPDDVAAALVRWVVRAPRDCLLDPACGDGRFLVHHQNGVGVEQDDQALEKAKSRAPWASIHHGNFFVWAQNTNERFECAAGNPPFIRYQHFNGIIRKHALEFCRELGASFSGLTSSWAPFLVSAASLLKPGGRMAFVVPAEIGHAPYAVPLINYLLDHFAKIQLIAVREKIFTDLSEDCWLLFAENFGGKTREIGLSQQVQFSFSPEPPGESQRIGIEEWRSFNFRLRPFLLPEVTRVLYRDIADAPSSYRFGDLADVGIGYVTGANDFFHLRPSVAERAGIPKAFLIVAIRNSKMLTSDAVTPALVAKWIEQDAPVLLLRIERGKSLPESVRQYLDSPEGKAARESFKCRVRTPWYVVPDVSTPSAFLSYMSTREVRLVANPARCVSTNSVHAVNLKGKLPLSAIQDRWKEPLSHLSCEIEGHPLGGGMLKIEPGEAKRILIRGDCVLQPHECRQLEDGIDVMRQWRHNA